MNDCAYTITNAKYGKRKQGLMILQCPSTDGYKTRAARLAEHLNGRWTNREGGYVLSPNKIRKFEQLFNCGADASSITGELYDKQ